MLRTLLPAAAICAALLSSAAMAQAGGHPVEIAHPEAPGVTLSATLTLPEGEGPFPAVVMISGSGPQDRDMADPDLAPHRPFAVWADDLAERGVASLRYDDRGVAASTGDFAAATAQDLASDAAAAYAALRANPAIDPERSGYLGISEGGAVAMIAAQSDAPGFIIMLSGPAVDFREVFSGQYIAQQFAGGDSQEAIEANQQFLGVIYAALDEVEGAPHGAARAHLAGVFDSLGLPYEAGLDMLSSDYMRSWVAHDMRAAIRAYDGPVLGVYGEYDIQVDVVQNAAALGGLIDPRDGSAVRIFPAHNHLLQSVDSLTDDPAAQDHAVSPAVLDAVGAWILAR